MKKLIAAFVFMASVTMVVNQANAQVTIPPALINAIIQAQETCINGGPNSTTCSITLSVSGGATVLGTGGNGGVSISHSVGGCSNGTYACCNIFGATCKE